MDTIELKECGVILHLPENTISAEINVQYMNEDGEIKKVQKSLSPSEIYKAMKDYEDNYDDPDARYVITDEGLEYLEKRGEI